MNDDLIPVLLTFAICQLITIHILHHLVITRIDKLEKPLATKEAQKP